jgi:hypothetical protein
MEAENKLPMIMQCPGSFVLTEDGNQEITRGEGNLILDAEKLTLLPISGETLLIPYRDIIQITEVNYRIEVKLVSKESLTLFNLGYKYEDFFTNFSNLNNEVMLKDLLMNETILKSGLKAQATHIDENKIGQAQGQCELRVYETGLVIITQGDNFTRIPYSDMARLRLENFTLYVDTDYDETYLFSKMGRELDSCYRMLNDLINKLSQNTQMTLRELFPQFDSSIIRKAARLMKDGRAVSRSDIEAISPGLWEQLEKKIDVLGLKEEYEYLKSVAQAEKMSIGIKRGLMGDLTGEYIWFLAPIFNIDPVQPGNAIAMEAASGDSSGRATYFFQITDRNRYSSFKTMQDLDTEVEKALKRINRHLIAVNFRREPIYLTDEQLNSAAFAGYRRAVAKIASLRELRRLFIGRIMHHSAEQWKGAVMQLLWSNVKNG